jgi:hypothetical protein
VEINRILPWELPLVLIYSETCQIFQMIEGPSHRSISEGTKAVVLRNLLIAALLTITSNSSNKTSRIKQKELMEGKNELRKK